MAKEESLLTHLDRLLADKPPEFKAKVLHFTINSGMQPDNLAFRLVQYISYKVQFLLTAPDEWEKSFNELQQKLNQWNQTTARKLIMYLV